MSASNVRVQPDSTGKFIQTHQNNIGGTLVEAQAVALVTSAGVTALDDTLAVKAASTPPAASDKALVVALSPNRPATYTASVSGQANTASGHAIAIESGASKKFRLKRLVIWQPGLQTAAGLRVLQLLRTTAAGSGGAVTPAQHDTTDAAFSGIVRAKPATPGTAGTVIKNIPVFVPAALAAFTPIILDFPETGDEAVIVQNGIANGLALLDPGAAGGANFAAEMSFVEV